MTGRIRPRPVGILRAYGIALGFALGQVGPDIAPVVRPRPAVVRDMEHERTPDGFHPLERLSPSTVLTMPLEGPHAGSDRPPFDSSGRFGLN